MNCNTNSNFTYISFSIHFTEIKGDYYHSTLTKFAEQKRLQNLVKHLRWSSLPKKQLSVVNYIRRKLHLRCLTGFWILLCRDIWVCKVSLHIKLSCSVLGFVQAKMGLTTGFGGGANLVELVGRRRAMQILMECKTMTATEARDIGLVDDIMPTNVVSKVLYDWSGSYDVQIFLFIVK